MTISENSFGPMSRVQALCARGLTLDPHWDFKGFRVHHEEKNVVKITSKLSLLKNRPMKSHLTDLGTQQAVALRVYLFDFTIISKTSDPIA